MISKKIAVISAICIMISSLSSCSNEFNPKEYVGSYLDINTESAKIDTVISEPRSFNGDGSTYVVMNFSDNPIAEEIKEKENWKQLPLTENLTIIVYGGEKDGEQINAFVCDYDDGAKTGVPLIPQIENGYYYFVDRHLDKKYIYNDSEIFNRESYNYTIAIYDEDTDLLYFWSEDT